MIKRMSIKEAKAAALEDFANTWVREDGERILGFLGSLAVEEALYKRAAELLEEERHAVM